MCFPNSNNNKSPKPSTKGYRRYPEVSQPNEMRLGDTVTP